MYTGNLSYPPVVLIKSMIFRSVSVLAILKCLCLALAFVKNF